MRSIQQAAGWVALTASVIVVVFGFVRYYQIRRHIGNRRNLYQLAETLEDGRGQEE